MCIYFKNIGFIVLLTFSLAIITLSQVPAAASVAVNAAPIPSATPTDNEVRARVKQLELQVETMRREMAELKALVSRNNVPGQTVIASSETKPIDVAKADPKPATPLKKDLGVDVGSARLTPYGTIFFNAFSNSHGTNNADVPIFATPTGGGNISSSVRQTRLGLKLEGAKVGNARLSAVVEADFFGGFPSIGTGENFGIMRVRLANVRLDWEKTSVVVGQDWMVFAPLNPTSIAAAGNPQMGAAGNNWARLPQFRVEHKLTPNILWQGAVLEPQTGDFATNAAFAVQPTSGAASQVPFLQSRIAFSGKDWFGSKKVGTIGLAGHYGRSRVFTGANNVRNDIESVGLATDWNLPLAKRLSLTGEAFFGRNLGGFQSGIFQSYNNDFAFRQGVASTAGGVRSIGTRGGWAQLAFTPAVLKDRLGIYGTFGIDDPNDSDLTSISHRDWRTKNVAFAAEMIYKWTPQFSLGLEFRRFQTTYLFSQRQYANHVNLGASYSF